MQHSPPYHMQASFIRHLFCHTFRPQIFEWYLWYVLAMLPRTCDSYGMKATLTSFRVLMTLATFDFPISAKSPSGQAECGMNRDTITTQIQIMHIRNHVFKIKTSKQTVKSILSVLLSVKKMCAALYAKAASLKSPIRDWIDWKNKNIF